jgi:hypothetical protein
MYDQYTYRFIFQDSFSWDRRFIVGTANSRTTLTPAAINVNTMKVGFVLPAHILTDDTPPPASTTT